MITRSYKIINESSDKGKTVHVREHDFRFPIVSAEWLEKVRIEEKRKERLLKICKLAETNPTLNDQLLKLEELYMLVCDDEDN
jgi:hypothetical protein